MLLPLLLNNLLSTAGTAVAQTTGGYLRKRKRLFQQAESLYKTLHEEIEESFDEIESQVKDSITAKQAEPVALATIEAQIESLPELSPVNAEIALHIKAEQVKADVKQYKDILSSIQYLRLMNEIEQDEEEAMFLIMVLAHG